MQAYIISDKDYNTELFTSLYEQIIKYLNDKGLDIIETSIGRDDLNFCVGCFGCWVKKPGECVIDDEMEQINRNFINSDVVVYLCPVVFGQFSANIKNAIDRWIPNVLPFFETRSDGSTMHPRRYKKYPKRIMIAYADELSDDDMTLFYDITNNHQRSVDVLRYTNKDDLIDDLNSIELKKVNGKL